MNKIKLACKGLEIPFTVFFLAFCDFLRDFTD